MTVVGDHRCANLESDASGAGRPFAPHVSKMSALLEKAARLGTDRDRLLRKAGVPFSAEALANGGLASMTRCQVASLYRECILEIESYACKEDGVSPSDDDGGVFKLLCYSILTCPTLSDVVDRLAELSAVLARIAANLSVHRDADLATFTVRWHRAQNHYAFLTDMLALSNFYRLFNWLIGIRIPLWRVTVRYPRQLSDEHISEHFEVPLNFNGLANSITFPARFLQYPVIRNDSELKDFLKYTPFDPMPADDESCSVSKYIRMIYRSSILHGDSFPSFGRLAALFAQSESTLRRHLGVEGMTINEIKDQVRRDVACELLTRSDLRGSEIAERLGFSNSETFRRAFKRWTGKSPAEFRLG